jgi:rare lipoprotein A
MSVHKFGIGVLIMGLALSASAKDATNDTNPSTKIQPPGSNAKAKTSPKTATHARRWLQVGVASWYGPRFQGRTTAAGEQFDMNQMTCAHPTLPMGTWLRVTNLRNHRSTFVRVNDRGPVVDGRIVDLSFAAARKLGLVGVGKVRLEAVRNGDPTLSKELVAQLQFPVLIDPTVR